VFWLQCVEGRLQLLIGRLLSCDDGRFLGFEPLRFRFAPFTQACSHAAVLPQGRHHVVGEDFGRTIGSQEK